MCGIAGMVMEPGAPPPSPATLAALTQALAGSTDAKERGLVPALLQRARELDPGSPFLRARISGAVLRLMAD